MQISRFLYCMLIIITTFCFVGFNCQNATAIEADVGVILDLDTILGKICRTCISMAIDDFYSDGLNRTTLMVPHFRDSRTDVVSAASAAIDLLKNSQVMAILGPQNSIQADFLIGIGDRVRVPIISPATSQSLSPEESPYLIRSSWSPSSQAKAIAALVQAFGWKGVVFVYDDSNYGSGLLPYLAVNLGQSNIVVSNLSSISTYARNDQLLQQLQRLKSMQTRVFIVHMVSDLASRFFRMAKEVGMMSEGYAWLISDPLTSLLSSVDPLTIEAVQGALGVKAHVPRSEEVRRFAKRWRQRFHEENPDIERAEVNVFGLWAYDSTTALAEAIERVGVPSPRFKKPVINTGNSTDLEDIGTLNTGPSLAHALRNLSFNGLSGDFNIINSELQPSAVEIVNVIGAGEITVGFWTEKHGISRELKVDDNDKVVPSTGKASLGGILWPGQTIMVPRGWEIAGNGKKLRVLVPVRSGLNQFINFERDAVTNTVNVSGFSIDVFNKVIQEMPYALPYEYVPFELPDGHPAVDDVIYQTFLQRYDVMLGVTVSAERSSYVDFSAPYIESGVAIVIPSKDDESKNTWIFMKPLTIGLWLIIGAFFLFTGIVIWILEHSINKEFQGPPLHQVGTMFWFSFSTLVFSHREKVISNLTRFVVIVWVFVVLVLQSSYTANLASMLTVQQLQPKDIYDLINRGEYIGCQDSSLVKGFLNTMKVDLTKFRLYKSFKEYDEALSKGSKHGGIGAIVDELPTIRLFLSMHCHKYTMIDSTYRTSGYGFAFQKGSPIVADVSRGILELKENGVLDLLAGEWLGDKDRCLLNNGTSDAPKSLSLDNFKGLFIIAGVSSSSAIAIFLSIFLYKNRRILSSTLSNKHKLYHLARVFDDRPLPSSAGSTVHAEMDSSRTADIRISCDEESSSPSVDEGKSSSSIELQPTQDVLPPQ